jgi:hypothetical protein
MAALLGLIRVAKAHHQPRTITHYTYLSMVNHVLTTGRGRTAGRSRRLQMFYFKIFSINQSKAHALVVRWVTSAENLAGPHTGGVLAPEITSSEGVTVGLQLRRLQVLLSRGARAHFVSRAPPLALHDNALCHVARSMQDLVWWQS